MLIDYKRWDVKHICGLPHIIASITNLEDPNLIERARISLKAELERRQKLFIQAGNVQHLLNIMKQAGVKKNLYHIYLLLLMSLLK